ncbi:MAG: PAS domain-containing protein [Desulfuromonadales bacterium]|nr:PAS domain-containing protein [Desulfuromonadales bacterium]
MKKDTSTHKAMLCACPVQGTSHCHLLQGSPIPTFVIDENHSIIFWNRAIEYVSGFSAESMINTRNQWMPFYNDERSVMADLIVDGASEEEFSRYYGSIWRRSRVIEEAYESEGFFPAMGEQGTWLYFTASPLLDTEGRTIGAIETLQDISERKFAEAALKASRENLEDLVEQRTFELKLAHQELKVKAENLEQANEELSQYAFVASHDLRSPLRAIRNYTDFLHEELDSLLDDEQRGYFRGLFSALRHGDELVSDLLEFSRVSSSPVIQQDIHLTSIIDELRGTLDLPADADLTISGVLPVVYSDRTLLNQIFQNLIANGIKFNRSTRRNVEVGLADQHLGTCEVFVRDNGIGIDPLYHDRIFKMFKRLHTHKEFEGTGIGLAIVKKSVLKLNGSVRVESKVGEGSAFYITLPLARKDTDSER